MCLGHEGAGVVEALGADVKTLKVYAGSHTHSLFVTHFSVLRRGIMSTDQSCLSEERMLLSGTKDHAAAPVFDASEASKPSALHVASTASMRWTSAPWRHILCFENLSSTKSLLPSPTKLPRLSCAVAQQCSTS